jgi:hypothetical protein
MILLQHNTMDPTQYKNKILLHVKMMLQGPLDTSSTTFGSLATSHVILKGDSVNKL